MKHPAINPTREQDYASWYLEVIKAADLAQHSPVRGCMIIKPWGYALWENMQKILDQRFKKLGHQNIYLPMFIPLSFFNKEAEHVTGFAKECAIVTHHQLVEDQEKGLIPGGELEEPLVVRPTSEALFGYVFKQWIASYRDLPMCLNQWANVVRWEMRTRMFLRTSEFLWQEGHTAHASAQEADDHAKMMLETYRWFAEHILAIPVICGEKTENERFGGADKTYTIEAMMQDGKALQAGTSHYLGQNFSKAFEVTFQNKNNEPEHVYNTSWGVTTRMIGALIMTHGDDDGLRLPPGIAPYQVVVLPIHKNGISQPELDQYAFRIQQTLESFAFDGQCLRVHIDNRDLSGGEKSWSWYKKGVPIRIEIGQRELDEQKICLVMRTEGYKARRFLSIDAIFDVVALLDQIQTSLWNEAKQRMDVNTVALSSQTEIEQYFAQDGCRGFVKAHFGLSKHAESQWCKMHGVTVRCQLPESPQGPCFVSGKMAPLVILARAY